jgi:hypothetical protein
MKAPGLAGSFWPSPLQERLLRLVLADDADVEPLWRELQPLPFERLETGTFCLLPPVYARLTAGGVEDDLLPRLRGAYRSAWYRNQLRLDRLRPALEALAENGVEAIAPGGLAVAARYYPELALRPVPLIELAVQPEDGPATREILERLDWRLVGGRSSGFARYTTADGVVPLFLHEGVPPLVGGPVPPGAALQELRAGAELRPLGEAAAWMLDPSDELVVACGLGASTAVVQSPQWLLDTHRVIVTAGVSAEAVAARAVRFRLVPAVRDTLRYLERLVRDDRLRPLLDALERTPTSRRDELVHRLAGAGPGRFGGVPPALVAHARATLDQPTHRTVTGAPRAVAAAWEIDRARLPLVAAEKALARVRRSVRRRAGRAAPS